MNRFVSNSTKALALVLVLGLVGIAQAKDKPLKGKISSVAADGLSFQITTHKDPTPVTVTADTSTTVSIDGVAGKKISDLTAGLYVTVTPSTGTALTVEAFTKKPAKPGAGTPPPATPPAPTDPPAAK